MELCLVPHAQRYCRGKLLNRSTLVVPPLMQALLSLSHTFRDMVYSISGMWFMHALSAIIIHQHAWNSWSPCCLARTMVSIHAWLAWPEQCFGTRDFDVRVFNPHALSNKGSLTACFKKHEREKKKILRTESTRNRTCIIYTFGNLPLEGWAERPQPSIKDWLPSSRTNGTTLTAKPAKMSPLLFST